MLEPKRVSESQVTMSQVMLPSDANATGNVHGGSIMKLVDTAGAVAAMRHSRHRVVTAEIDSMSFLSPAYVGDMIVLKSSVTGVGRTSMEVGVKVEAENLLTGELCHISTAYLVYVALDDNGCPTEVPKLIAETEADERRMREAALRRERRLAEMKEGTR